MRRPTSVTGAARRFRSATGLTLLAVALSACGLQQTGLDGSVSASSDRVSSTTGGDVPGTTGSTGTSTPGGTGGAGGSSGAGPTGAGTSGGPGTTSTSGTTGNVISGGTSGASGTTGSPTTTTSGGRATGATLSPGLKGDLTVSYVNVTGFDQLGQVVVVKTASTGNAVAQTNALASYVNSHGGIAGRKLLTKVHDYNAMQASEVNDNNLCQTITGTDHAFLAVLHGQIHYSARDCYSAKKVLAFEGAAYGFGSSFYAAHSPSLWSPSYADYDQTERALVATIKAKKWLAGETKVGVVLWDDKPYHDVADKTLVPLLKSLGVTVVQTTISNSDIGAIENGIHASAQTMIANQVDHLLFLGSAPLQPFFVQQNQQYNQFVYGLTSFDVPRYMATNFPKNMAGAIGVGFSAVDDVLDAQHPFPQPGLETTCKGIYQAAGISIPGRYVDGTFNSKQAMSYCESTLLLKKAADAVSGTLTAASWTAVAQGLGSSFQAAQTFGTSYSSSKHTGAAAYREIAYSAGCSCMTYTTGNRAFS